MASDGSELKRVIWQYENRLLRLVPLNDPINADLLERGKCIHAKLKGFDLMVSGRDWCNLYSEVRQRQIDLLQEKAIKAEDEGKAKKQVASKSRRFPIPSLRFGVLSRIDGDIRRLINPPDEGESRFGRPVR